MALSLSFAAGAGVLTFLLWRIFGNYLRRSPLDNLPSPPVPSFLLGHLSEMMKPQGWKYLDSVNETYGPVYSFRGPFGKKLLNVYDPVAMHSVLIKDAEQGWPKGLGKTDKLQLLLGPGLLTTGGTQHRKQRKMLNPVFSTAHLRHMTHMFYDIAHKMRGAITNRVGKDAQEIDVNGWMARTTLEMLGQAGLGYSFDNFVEDSTDAYGESLKLFFPLLMRVRIFGMFVAIMSRFFSFSESTIRSLSRRMPIKDIRKIMSIADTMTVRSKEIIDEKKAALKSGDEELVQRVGEGKDVMSILLKANTAASDAEKLTDDELVAQMSTLIVAGMDTTSNALSRVLHILAQRPDAQEKLRAELQEACGGADTLTLSYDDLVKLPYLDAVCRETLRLHAPVQLITRLAAKDLLLPLSSPVRGKDGLMMNEVPVPRGTIVVLQLKASNCNKALWGEDAMEWRPERWQEPLPGALEDARIPGVYSNLLTFSGGTRSCIGFKFSQLEMKVILSVLLTSFKFELTGKPVTWNASAVIFPTMGEDSKKPEMLLRVQAL
ncbi:cytochrome P450 [Daedaleopsis nitida]|nr:cytochrome P450 [Daedaleopsis nitida]